MAVRAIISMIMTWYFLQVDLGKIFLECEVSIVIKCQLPPWKFDAKSQKFKSLQKGFLAWRKHSIYSQKSMHSVMDLCIQCRVASPLLLLCIKHISIWCITFLVGENFRDQTQKQNNPSKSLLLKLKLKPIIFPYLHLLLSKCQFDN